MELREGMKLELMETLLGRLKKGTIFEIIDIDEDANLETRVIARCHQGDGDFSEEEINQYFIEYVERDIEDSELFDYTKFNELEEYKDVEKIICNEPVTIVIFKNGIKGISKCLDEDKFNAEVGVRIAYLKAKRKEIDKELRKY